VLGVINANEKTMNRIDELSIELKEKPKRLLSLKGWKLKF